MGVLLQEYVPDVGSISTDMDKLQTAVITRMVHVQYLGEHTPLKVLLLA